MRVTKKLTIHYSFQPVAAFGEMGVNGSELRVWRADLFQTAGLVFRGRAAGVTVGSYEFWESVSTLANQSFWGVSHAPLAPHRAAWPTLLGPFKDANPDGGSKSTSQFMSIVDPILTSMRFLALPDARTGTMLLDYPTMPSDFGGAKKVSIDLAALAAEPDIVDAWDDYREEWIASSQYFVSGSAPVGSGRSSVSIVATPGVAHTASRTFDVVCLDSSDPTAVWHLVDSARNAQAVQGARDAIASHLTQVNAFIEQANLGNTPTALPVWSKPAALDSPFLTNDQWTSFNQSWSALALARGNLNQDRALVAGKLDALKTTYGLTTDEEARDVARLLGAGMKPADVQQLLDNFDGTREGSWVLQAAFDGLSAAQKTALTDLYSSLPPEEQGSSFLSWLGSTAWPALKDGIGWASGATVDALKSVVSKAGDVVQDWGPTGTLGFLGGYQVLTSDEAKSALSKWGVPVAVVVGIILLLSR